MADSSAGVSAEQLSDVAMAAAQAAAKVLLQRPAELQVSAKSSATDAVTQMDVAAEAAIGRVLAERRPADAVLAEEGGATAGRSAVTWVVDPLDGTVNYLYGRPDFAVSVAAVAGGPDPLSWQVLAGVVIQPATSKCWHAWSGGGAWCDGHRLAPQADPDVELSLVGTGFGYQVDSRRHQAQVVAQLLPQVRDIRRCGAAALDLCAVADGSLDGYYEWGLGPWDFAAGALLVAESGRLISGPLDGDWTAGPPSGLGVVAGGPRTATGLASILTHLV